MTPIVTTCQDTRWPVILETDAGQVFMTIHEAEHLIRKLEVVLYVLDSIKRQSDSELKLAA